MRFIAIVISAAVTASLAIAGPIVETRDGLTPADGVPAGVVTRSPVGREEERAKLNPFENRSPSAIMYLCPEKNCQGDCWHFFPTSNPNRPNQCYEVQRFKSLYIDFPNPSLPYKIYVGDKCKKLKNIPTTNQCIDTHPPGRYWEMTF